MKYCFKHVNFEAQESAACQRVAEDAAKQQEEGWEHVSFSLAVSYSVSHGWLASVYILYRRPDESEFQF